MKNYLWLLVSVSPFLAIPTGVWAFMAGATPVAAFLVCYGASASIGCARLLNDFWHHGIHNDR